MRAALVILVALFGLGKVGASFLDLSSLDGVTSNIPSVRETQRPGSPEERVLNRAVNKAISDPEVAEARRRIYEVARSCAGDQSPNCQREMKDAGDDYASAIKNTMGLK
jgi:hypothetical protein